MALDYTIIGERLKKARTDKKMTQERLAEKLDVSIAFLSRIERGNSHINGASSKSENYLTSEFNDILNNASPEKQKLIYKIAKVICEEE